MVCFPKHFYQNCKWILVVRTPYVFLLMVWALPISLATTLGIIVYFLFLWVLRCFSSPRSPLTYYFTHMQILEFFSSSEFPHSDIYESTDICSSSQLFAAYHVLLRLLVPRHSPYALCSLTLFLFGFIVNKFQCLTLSLCYLLVCLVYLFYLYIFFNVLSRSSSFFDNLLVELKRVELLTSCLQGRRSSQLSYSPNFILLVYNVFSIKSTSYQHHSELLIR